MTKKFFASIGLAVAGAATVHAAYSPDSSDNSKIWAVSGTLRGFYDDNYLTAPKKVGSYGFEVSPSFTLNAPLEQTEIGVRYVYGLYYYQKREELGQNPIDQSHEFDLWVDHAFTPRWETRFEDTVTVSQEPGLGLPVGQPTAIDNRIEGNNLVNGANISLTTDWTEEFSTKLSYGNTFYSYDNSGAVVSPGAPFPPTSVAASLSGLLDRDENLASINFQWTLSQETMAWVGYQYGQVIYLSSEPIAVNTATTPNSLFTASSRDNRSHYGYVGVSHNFLDNLTGSFQAGIQYTTYYDDTTASSSLGPYGNASLVYTYAAGSYAEVGLTETRNATDVASVGNNGLTEDQESTVVYGSINHPLTPKLIGTLTGNYQYSIYHGGPFQDQAAELVDLGVNLTYTFTPHLSAEAGYNFDWYKTEAALVQDYNRNRVYLGVTATY
ncbi:MAG TPA: outer membrane beta-barrel protein [Verrucomicrobiae bacterium]|jgi:hypothetical protein